MIKCYFANLNKPRFFEENLFPKSKVPHIVGAGGATHPIQGQIDLQFSIGGLLLSNILRNPSFKAVNDFGNRFSSKK
jgi:hypothetical protein